MNKESAILFVAWLAMICVLVDIVGYVQMKENEKTHCQCEETR